GGKVLRNGIAIITRHRLSAYVAGLVTTLITQSSAATSVMLVSLVSARLMTLGQSLGMILGSDLGTTFTVQLFAFKFFQIAPLLIAAGFFSTMGSSNGKFYTYGKLTMATGFIFYGIYMMTESVAPLRSLPIFVRMMHISFTNPFFGLLAGTIITAVLHSSAATLAITITIYQSFQGSSNELTVAAGFFPVILGANLGTCITAFISTFKASIEGVRVAWAHFVFKLFGTILVFPFTPLIQRLDLFRDYSPALQIAIYHTLFALFISIVFLPVLRPFERFLLKIVKPGKKSQQKFHVEFIHDNTLNIPHLALSQAMKEVARMADKATLMIDNSRNLLENFDIHKKNILIAMDDEVDFLHENILKFLTRISREELNPDQTSQAYELIMITTDLEHIGDIVSKTIANLAEKIENSPLPLSSEGKQDILEFYDRSTTNLKEVLAAFVMRDHALAQSVSERKSEIRVTYDKLFERHMNRLYTRKPESLQTTAIHSDLLEEIRRINHYTFRIAENMLKENNFEYQTV
ncbi:MAG: Na/Pi cotransporter family protein, partial [Fibrobacter sp.]|nr:Na/Pi cotransporter family protein [Fibrobacter sp.]